MENPTQKSSIIKIINTRLVIAVIFAYLTGLALLHYLGVPPHPGVTMLGLLTVILVVESRNFLAAYYDHPDSPFSTINLLDPREKGFFHLKRSVLLQIALSILALGAMITTLLILQKSIGVIGFFLILTALLVSLVSTLPPFRLEKKGYGELLESVLVANLVPSIAFAIKSDSVHILLLMLTLPLTFTYLAMKISLSFHGYGLDEMYNRQSLVVRLGWQRAMTMHNLLLLGAFLLIGIFFFNGLPWVLTWPILTSLPVAGFQVFQMQQITGGGKPHWQLLKWVAIGLFFIMIYLIMISLWTG